MVAGTEGGGAFSSATAGIAWADDSTGLTGSARDVRQVVASAGRLYAATSAGLFTRTTGGTTWTPLGQGEGPGKLNAAVQALRVDGPVIVAGTASRGIFRSADGGETWAQATIATPNESIWSIAAPAIGSVPLYAAGGSGVYRSDDGGSSWQRRSDGIPFGVALRVVVSPTDPLRVYASTTSGVFRSVNGGMTWGPANGEGPTALGDTSAPRALLLAPSGFGQGERFLVGTAKGVWASKDGGKAWGQMAPDSVPGEDPVGGQEVWSLAYDPIANPLALIAGTRARGVHALPLQPIAAAPGKAPTIGDTTPTVGQLLTSSSKDAWQGSRPYFVAVRWQRCTAAGANCQDIPGATGDEYAVEDDDEGGRLRTVMTAGNVVSPGTVTQTSALTSIVAGTPSPRRTRPRAASRSSRRSPPPAGGRRTRSRPGSGTPPRRASPTAGSAASARPASRSRVRPRELLVCLWRMNRNLSDTTRPI
jgi:photosystem II stability/assembly factor-like uncharacterized protein